MSRARFNAYFGSSHPVVLPVVHVVDMAQASSNIQIVRDGGAAGCFLINHNFPVREFLPIVRTIRHAFPYLWLGVNFLGLNAREAFAEVNRLAEEGFEIDGLWTDNAHINEFEPEQEAAEAIVNVHRSLGWDGLYFGGTAFKYQRTVLPEHYVAAAKAACGFMDVITTTGPGTGEPADPAKINAFREGAGDHPVAVASGITPENAKTFSAADCFIVATGINRPGDFYNIDPIRLANLIGISNQMCNSY